jgi:hypothetical protein
MTMTTRFLSVRALAVALAIISFQPLPAAQTPASRMPQKSQTSPAFPTSMTLDVDAVGLCWRTCKREKKHE